MTENTLEPMAFAARWASRRSRRTSCCAWPTRWAGCSSAPRSPDGADRQGHPHFGLHAGARWKRLQLGRRRCGAAGAAAHAGRGLPHPRQRASLGVVISASHNPFPDNGIKFFSAQGAKLPDAWELAVEAALEEARSGWIRPTWARPAGWTMRRALHRVLQEHLRQATSRSRAEDRGGRGAWCGLPHRTQGVPRAGRRGVAIGCAPDGLNINHEVGATHPQALVERCGRTGRLRRCAGRRCRPAATGRRAGPPVQWR
jgi:hypothetical protein